MGLISRLYNFAAGTPIIADQVDAELDQILSLVNGNLDSANVNTAAINAFLKLAVSANRKIAFGGGAITWPGGSGVTSNAVFAHGLGVTPVIALACLFTNTASFSAGTSVQIVAYDATNLTIVGSRSDTPPAATAQQIAWIAIA